TLPLESLSHETTEHADVGSLATRTTTASSIRGEEEEHERTTYNGQPVTEKKEHEEIQVTQNADTEELSSSGEYGQQLPDIHGETEIQTIHDDQDTTGVIEQESIPEVGEGVSEGMGIHHETVPDLKGETLTTSQAGIQEQPVTSAEGVKGDEQAVTSSVDVNLDQQLVSGAATEKGEEKPMSGEGTGSDKNRETSAEKVEESSPAGPEQEKVTQEPGIEQTVTGTVANVEQSVDDVIENNNVPNGERGGETNITGIQHAEVTERGQATESPVTVPLGQESATEASNDEKVTTESSKIEEKPIEHEQVSEAEKDSVPSTVQEPSTEEPKIEKPHLDHEQVTEKIKGEEVFTQEELVTERGKDSESSLQQEPVTEGAEGDEPLVTQHFVTEAIEGQEDNLEHEPTTQRVKGEETSEGQERVTEGMKAERPSVEQ
ncbi:hypothetical protein B7P43_G06275, partial [Cryptotermes secundus]